MSESHRTPHSAERAEGDPPGEQPGSGRTPHPEEPAEGRADDAGGGADTPDT
jgi:ribokinase